MIAESGGISPGTTLSRIRRDDSPANVRRVDVRGPPVVADQEHLRRVGFGDHPTTGFELELHDPRAQRRYSARTGPCAPVELEVFVAGSSGTTHSSGMITPSAPASRAPRRSRPAVRRSARRSLRRRRRPCRGAQDRRPGRSPVSDVERSAAAGRTRRGPVTSSPSPLNRRASQWHHRAGRVAQRVAGDDRWRRQWCELDRRDLVGIGRVVEAGRDTDGRGNNTPLHQRFNGVAQRVWWPG